MEFEELILPFLIILVVFGIIITVTLYFVGPERITEILFEKAANELMIGKTSATGVVQRPDTIGGTYFYDITVTPRLSVTNRMTENQGVFALIEFKDKSVRARINGDKDFFTITPNDKTIDHVLHAGISSEIPPIRAYRDFYNEDLGNGQQILIKSGTGAALVSVNVKNVRSITNPLSDFCEAVFRFEGGCVPGTLNFPGNVKRTGPMTGCAGETGSDCEQSVDLCAGVVTVKIDSKPDCTSDKVKTYITYEDGEKFDAGETVTYSLWRTGCEAETDDAQQMKVVCSKFLLFKDSINVGILPGFDA